MRFIASSNGYEMKTGVKVTDSRALVEIPGSGCLGIFIGRSVVSFAPIGSHFCHLWCKVEIRCILCLSLLQVTELRPLRSWWMRRLFVALEAEHRNNLIDYFFPLIRNMGYSANRTKSKLRDSLTVPGFIIFHYLSLSTFQSHPPNPKHNPHPLPHRSISARSLNGCLRIVKMISDVVLLLHYLIKLLSHDVLFVIME